MMRPAILVGVDDLAFGMHATDGGTKVVRAGGKKHIIIK